MLLLIYDKYFEKRMVGEGTLKERNGSHDLLRILAAFSVVLIHVNATFFVKHFNGERETTAFIYHIEELINLLTRFSVPCFVMLSGAYNLNSKNRNYKDYYIKIWRKTVLPFLVIAVGIFFLVEVAVVCGFLYPDPIEPVLRFIKGELMNWWFMYMIIGLYILTPVIVHYKESVSVVTYQTVAYVWLVFSVISQSTSTYKVAYSFGTICSYIGYYMVGNAIHERKQKAKRPYFFLIAALCICGITYYLRDYFQIRLYTLDAYASFFSPGVVVMSILVFLFFDSITIKLNLVGVAGLTYYVYLFHTIIYILIFAVLGSKCIINELVTIVVVTCLTFVLSFIAAGVFQKVWAVFIKRLRKDSSMKYK